MKQYIDKSALVAEIERRINEINLDSIEDWRYRLQREHDIEVMKNILSLIDTFEVKEGQEEPVSVWHNMDEVPIKGEVIVVQTKDTFYGLSIQKGGTTYKNKNKDRYVRWAYASELLNLSNVQRTVKDWKEMSVSEDLEKHISLITERMLKEGPLPTLKGKDKADFENEFNRFKQITGMINWPAREEIYKNVILWFIAWSKEHLKIGDIVDKSEMDKQPVNKDLEEAANEWDAKASFTPFYMALDGNGNPYEIKQDYTTHAESFKAGAKWQKQNLWKPADGDDLPEYEREVVVFTQNFPDDAGIMSVAIGHRPNPNGWDGKSITTGNIEHYTPMTYGKGGWNIPDIVYWLDVELPKEIEEL